MSRPVERLYGGLAAVVGIAGVLYACFGPVYFYDRYANGVHTSGSQSLWQHGATPVTVLYLIPMTGLFLLFPIVADRDGRRPSARTLLALTGVAVLLVGGSILGFAATGMILAPGALLAVVTVIGAGLRRPFSRRPYRARPA